MIANAKRNLPRANVRRVRPFRAWVYAAWPALGAAAAAIGLATGCAGDRSLRTREPRREGQGAPRAAEISAASVSISMGGGSQPLRAEARADDQLDLAGGAEPVAAREPSASDEKEARNPGDRYREWYLVHWSRGI
jgi:hypothetical protein